MAKKKRRKHKRGPATDVIYIQQEQDGNHWEIVLQTEYKKANVEVLNRPQTLACGVEAEKLFSTLQRVRGEQKLEEAELRLGFDALDALYH